MRTSTRIVRLQWKQGDPLLCTLAPRMAYPLEVAGGSSGAGVYLVGDGAIERIDIVEREVLVSSRFCAAAIVPAIANLLSAAATVTPSVRVTSTTVPANVSTAISIVVDGRPFAPVGTITLKEGSTVLGTSSSLAVGGLFNVSALFATSGPHTVVAFYSGDANYLPAQSPPTVVQAVATSITLTGTGPAGLVFGIRATVTGPGPCAGNVTFSEAGRVLYSGSLQPGAVNVDFQVSPNPQVADGPHTFSAAFSTNSPACGPGVSAPFPVYTGVLSSTTEIVSVTPNPSLCGQLPATLVRVHAASGVATGRVAIWYRGGIKPSILAQGDLDASGTIHLTLPSQPMGSWPVTAEYSGSATVKPSVSAPFTVVGSTCNYISVRCEWKEIDCSRLSGDCLRHGPGFCYNQGVLSAAAYRSGWRPASDP